MQQYVWFYQLGKRYNSTKQPDSDTMSRYELCTIKENFDLLNPQLTLHTENVYYFPASETDSENVSRKISDYTMVLLNGRYYRIDNITYNSVEATVYLNIDVLASFKHGITGEVQLVARSDNENVINTNIPDENAVCTGNIYTSTTTSPAIFSPDEDEGSIVIATLNGGGANYGNVTYYRLANVEDLKYLQSNLFSNVDWLNIGDLSEEMTKALVNPLQYFVSCKQFPFIVAPEYDYSDTPLTNDDGEPATEMSDYIRFGFWQSDVVAWRFLDNFASISGDVQMRWMNVVEIEIPEHPQTAYAGKFVNLSPYSVYTLNLEPFGQIAIDPLKIYGCKRIRIEIKVDVVSGSAIMTLTGIKEIQGIVGTFIDERFISKHYANVATDHIVAQATTDVLKVGTTAVNTAIETVGHIGGAAYSAVANFGADVANHVTSALTSAVSGASDIYRNSFPQCSKQGNMGYRFVDRFATLHCEFREVTVYHTSFTGRPSCKQAVLSNSGDGFYKLISPKYSNNPNRGIVCTLEEQHRLLKFMEEGFYLE